MDLPVIFAAKYLIIVPPLIALYVLWTLPRHRSVEYIITGILSLALAYAIAKTASLFYMNPRPFVVGDFTPLISHAADNGFPSDHALFAAAIAAVVTLFNIRAGLALWGIALVVGIARVLAGVHHPIDIAGSMLIAAIAAGITHLLWNKRSRFFR